jgi:prevent-host-death family protein
MDSVASRDLRNHTADVLRRVAEGGAVTVHGKVVAEIHPPSDPRPRSWSRAELVRWLAADNQADRGLRDQLREMEQYTDEVKDPWS